MQQLVACLPRTWMEWHGSDLLVLEVDTTRQVVDGRLADSISQLRNGTQLLEQARTARCGRRDDELRVGRAAEQCVEGLVHDERVERVDVEVLAYLRDQAQLDWRQGFNVESSSIGSHHISVACLLLHLRCYGLMVRLRVGAQQHHVHVAVLLGQLLQLVGFGWVASASIEDGIGPCSELFHAIAQAATGAADYVHRRGSGD